MSFTQLSAECRLVDKRGDAVDNSFYLRLYLFENSFTMTVQGFSHSLTTGELSTIIHSYPQDGDSAVAPLIHDIGICFEGPRGEGPWRWIFPGGAGALMGVDKPRSASARIRGQPRRTLETHCGHQPDHPTRPEKDFNPTPAVWCGVEKCCCRWVLTSRGGAPPSHARCRYAATTSNFTRDTMPS